MFNAEVIIQEFKFKGIRSSGSGGQHVNKVSSKVELTFSIKDSLALNEEQKETILQKLKNRLTKEGVLKLYCGESRSQHRNKNLVIVRAIQLLKSTLVHKKKRVPTKVPKAVIMKRLKNKRKKSERKANRKRPDLD